MSDASSKSWQCWFESSSPLYSGVAQMVEQLICNHQVVGSNPTAGPVPGTPGAQKLYIHNALVM